MPARARLRAPHPLEHHAAFRAVIAAAPPLAAVASGLAAASVRADLVGALALTAGDLAAGFGAPPGSRARVQAHARAWVGVREIDRVLGETGRRRLVDAGVLQRAQRAVDRADVMITALPGVLPA